MCVCVCVCMCVCVLVVPPFRQGRSLFEYIPLCDNCYFVVFQTWAMKMRLVIGFRYFVTV